jgi:hypothetical protein
MVKRFEEQGYVEFIPGHTHIGAVQRHTPLQWEGDACECLWWGLCPVCSLCQEYRTVMPNVDLQGQWVVPVGVPVGQPMAEASPLHAAVDAPPETVVEMSGLPAAGRGPAVGGEAVPTTAAETQPEVRTCLLGAAGGWWGGGVS